MKFTQSYDWKNNDKCGIPVHLKTNNYIITYPDQKSNVFCNTITNVGPKYAEQYHNVKRNLQHSSKLPSTKLVFL